MNTKELLITDPKITYDLPHKYLGIFGMIWVSFLLMTSFTTIKTFDLFGLIFAAAALGYPITYIFSDIFTEVYGYKVSRKIVWSGLICVMITTVVATLYTYIPPSQYFGQTENEAFNLIFRSSPIIAFATIMAFLVGEFVNSYVLANLKLKTNGKFQEFRYVASTFCGQLLDNATGVSIILLASNLFSMGEAVSIGITTTIFCTTWEFFMIPFTRKFIKWIKEQEGIDTYDHGTNFNPFKLG
jgi:uncharacterized integral membrane protein (TIGR00697 family)